MKAYMYILLCGNGQYYVGSTKNLDRRLEDHHMGKGSNFTKKHLPLKLMYFEEYDSITLAFRREKQIQNWSHAKKDALINGNITLLKKLSNG
ncbi:GIY-YIG nuclease family protein [Cyclobacteriaceae bacterium YHN15]|nr:GIY-YIG nuclease family protein [Cyclobacteriaceae bacterium YHN15]